MLTLRDYQWKSVLFFSGHIAEGEKDLGLVSPTGSGKTLMLSTFMARIQPFVTGIVVACPSIQIEEGFFKALEAKANPLKEKWASSTASYRYEAEDFFLRLREEEAKKEDFTEYVSSKTTLKPALLTSHQQLVKWGIESLPSSLEGKLLIIDEAHHAGVGAASCSTQIGLITEEWKYRGGIVLYVTATPFRKDPTQEVFSKETKVFSRSLSEHLSEGYMPSNISYRTKKLTETAASARQFLGLATTKQNQSYKDMVETWVADGKPKGIFIVPAINSHHWVAGLIRELEKHTTSERILNAVGDSRKKQRLLTETLKMEQSVKEYSQSTIDVIIACRRFDEGVDWPLCSHLYNFGFPQSFTLCLQRWGRTFRSKKGIQGHPHAEEANITFFLPQLSDWDRSEIEKKHFKNLLLLVGHLADWETLQDVRSQIQELRRNSSKSSNKSEFEALCDEQEASIPDNLRSLLVSKLIQWEVGYLNSRGHLPDLKQFKKYVLISFEGKEREVALQILGERLISQEPGLLPSTELWKEWELDKDFDKYLEELIEKHSKKTLNMSGKTLELYSFFTGKDVSDVISDIQKHFVKKVYLTSEEVLKGVKEWEKLTGLLPKRDSGNASNCFGVSITWRQVDNFLIRNNGVTLHAFLVNSGLKGNLNLKLSLNQVLEAAKKHKELFGSVPIRNSVRASESFGFPICWKDVDYYLIRTQEKTLHQFLVSSGVKQKIPSSLSEEEIVSAAKKYFEREGKLPVVTRQISAFPDIGYDMTWKNINQRLGRQGTSLKKLMEKHSLKAVLTLDNVDVAIQSYWDANKKYPLIDGDASSYFTGNVSWEAVNRFVVKHHKKTLHHYMHEKGYKTNKPVKGLHQTSSLTVENIKYGILKYKKETGKVPTMKSGDATLYFDFPITWRSVNYFFSRRNRNIATSLTAFIQKEGLDENQVSLDNLTLEAIGKACKKHFIKHGCYPSRNTGDASEVIGFPITWRKLDKHLTKKFEMTLSQFKKGLPPFKKPSSKTIDQVSEEEIVVAAKEFFQDLGRYPNRHDKVISVGKLSWASLDTNLRKSGSSLKKLLVRNELETSLKLLTLEKIQEGAKKYQLEKNSWPHIKAGSTLPYTGLDVTWQQVYRFLKYRKTTLRKVCLELSNVEA